MRKGDDSSCYIPDRGEYAANSRADDHDPDGSILVNREVSQDEVSGWHGGHGLSELVGGFKDGLNDS